MRVRAAAPVLVALLAFALSARAAAALPAHVAAASGPRGHASGYCSSLPIVEVEKEAWGFHAGQPIPGPTSSYARGHGRIDLSASTASGIICQVDRARNAPERQIILAIDRHVIHASHYATMFGVPGNIIEIHVHVTSTTDPKCPVGTRGEATIFASYNNVHEDSVRFSFPAACRDHRRSYTGSDVVTNVPPN